MADRGDRADAHAAAVPVGVRAALPTLVLVLLAQGVRRDPFMDLALVSALLSFAGALTFVRFLERWV